MAHVVTAAVPTITFSQFRDAAVPLVVTPATHYGSPSRHTHDFYELVYVRSGGGIHQIHDRPYPIIAGDFYLMRPGVAHAYEVYGEMVHIYNVLFVPALFAAEDWARLCAMPGLGPFLAGDAGRAGHKLSLRPPHDHAVETLCERIRDELARREQGFELFARGLMLELLLTLNRLALTFPGARGDAAALEAGPVGSAVAYLHAHLAEPVSMADLAAAVGLSANYLGERFKAELGQTVADYLNRLRVDRARELLDRTDDSVTSIALDTGFDGASYFGKVFRKLTGHTPRAYRQLARRG